MAKNNNMLDVFISYRRQGGATAARLLYEVLQSRNIDCFMDAETLSRGDYNESIKRNIKCSRNFILIVSENVFESDWVGEEVRFAVQSKKNIIPVFVNGIVCFPDDVPEDLQFIKLINGVPLNHDGFEHNIKKLLSWLETKHSMLLNAYTAAFDEESILDGLFNTWVNASDERLIKRFLIGKVKSAWQARGDKLNAADIFEGFTTSELKLVARKLNISRNGERSNVMDNIDGWLKDRRADNIKSVINEDDERLDSLISLMATTWYRSGEPLADLKEYCRDLGILSLSSGKSPKDILSVIFNQSNINTVGEFFTLLSLDENHIKFLSYELLGNNTGRRNALISKISDWVNYQDE